MNKIYLIENNKEIILDNYEPNDIIINIYNEKYKIPEENKINKNNISNLNFSLLPLFDINTFNIYLIEENNIYSRIIENNYRFVDELILEYMKRKLENYEKELEYDKTDLDNYLIINRISNLKKSIIFISQFNLIIFENKFIKIFDNLGESKYKDLTNCIRPSYSNILPNTYYIKPYFSSIELINNKIIYNDDKTDPCLLSVYRDIPYIKLLIHQKHIIENNGAGILQYYSLIGSYQINSYLRELYKESKINNIILNSLIEKFWNIIITAPSFDDDFYVYRFINDDSFLKDLKIGDNYQDNGFMSTTRDPYYSSNYYNFGSILMKIKIPKNKIGVGLCLELFSHFGKEQEILLAPKTILKLVKLDKNVKYKHIEKDFDIKIKKKYEFELVNICPVKIDKKINTGIKNIDNIYKLEQINNNLEDFYNYLKNNYLNEINQVNFKIGNTYKKIIIEKIKIYPAYSSKVYFAADDSNPQDEIIIYYIENNEIIFFIEILEENNNFEINVNINNYYNYINQRIDDIFETNDFLLFLKKIGKFFDCNEIIISCDFISCQYFKDINRINLLINDYKEIRSGNFNFEIYKYFKEKKIRFGNYIKNNVIVPQFNFSILNKYENINMEDIINLTDSVELKQIFEIYQKIKNEKISVKNFFIYITENKCFLTSELSYIISLHEYKTNKNEDIVNLNPFYNPFYIFNVNNF